MTQAHEQKLLRPVRVKPLRPRIADPVSAHPSPCASVPTQLKAAKGPIRFPPRRLELSQLHARCFPSGHRKEEGLPLPSTHSHRATSRLRNTVGLQAFRQPRSLRSRSCRLSRGAALHRHRPPRWIKGRDHPGRRQARGEVRRSPSSLSEHRAPEGAEKTHSTCLAKTTTMQEGMRGSIFPSPVRAAIRQGSISEPLRFSWMWASTIPHCRQRHRRTLSLLLRTHLRSVMAVLRQHQHQMQCVAVLLITKHCCYCSCRSVIVHVAHSKPSVLSLTSCSQSYVVHFYYQVQYSVLSHFVITHSCYRSLCWLKHQH